MRDKKEPFKKNDPKIGHFHH